MRGGSRPSGFVTHSNAMSEQERRRAERVRSFEPLRIRVEDNRNEGVVVDLSQGGALMLLPTAPPGDRQILLRIDWREGTLSLQARVVRSEPRQVQMESAMLKRKEYYVAVEFVDVSPAAAAAIRRIIQND